MKRILVLSFFVCATFLHAPFASAQPQPQEKNAALEAFIAASPVVRQERIVDYAALEEALNTAIGKAQEAYDAEADQARYVDLENKKNALSALVDFSRAGAIGINVDPLQIVNDRVMVDEKFTFTAILQAKLGNYFLKIEPTGDLPRGSSLVPGSIGCDFRWIPAYDQQGQYTLEFMVKGTDIKRNMVIDVIDIAPPISLKAPVPGQVVKENKTLRLNLIDYVEHPYFASSLSFGFLNPDSLPRGVTLDNAGVLTYSPDYSVVRKGERIDTFSVQVDTYYPKLAIVNLSFEVKTQDVNRPPVIKDIEGLPAPAGNIYIFEEGNAYTFKIDASDEDRDVITYSVELVGAGAEKILAKEDNVDTLTWVPQEADVSGGLKLRFRADDGKVSGGMNIDAPLLVERIIENVTVKARPIPKIIIPSLGGSRIDIMAEKNINFSLFAKDQYGQLYGIALLKIPEAAAFAETGPAAYAFNWKPAYSQIGLHTLDFEATDAKGNKFNRRITVNVLDDRAHPADDLGGFARIKNIRMKDGSALDLNFIEGLVYEFIIDAEEPDRGAIYYSAFIRKSDGAGNAIGDKVFIGTVNSTSNSFTWIPEAGLNGKYILGFLATDSEAYVNLRADVREYVVTVKPEGLSPYKYREHAIVQAEYESLADLAKAVTGKPQTTQADIDNLEAKIQNGNVVELNLYKKGLRALPGTFKNLLNLKSLDLSDNQIADISLLSNLLKLEWLNLSGNRVSYIRPLSGLAYLKELHLYNNLITDISPIINLRMLRRLDASGNNIAVLPASLGALTSLEALDLSSNKITEVKGLNNAVSLLELDISKNAISDISNIAGLRNLEALDVSGNQIASIAALRNLEKLEELRLINNRIADISPLSDLAALRRLYLNKADTEAENPGASVILNNLREKKVRIIGTI